MLPAVGPFARPRRHASLHGLAAVLAICLAGPGAVDATSAASLAVQTARGQLRQTGPGQIGPGAVRPGQPARDIAVPRTGTARIRGVVTAADSGAPLRRVVVRLSSAELRQGRTTMTDGDGRYEFRDLPAGRFTLTFSKAGFVTLQYGQRRPFERGRPIELRDGEPLDAVHVSLPRGSVITGRVIDEFGDPVAGAFVTAMRYRFLRGQRRLWPAGGRPAETNDLGQYRIYGLPPGDYYVSATMRGSPVDAEQVEDAFGYAPTYFPGTASPDEAQPVTVSLGAESVADISLAPARLARVSGTVVDSAGKPVSSGFVNLAPRSGPVIGIAGAAVRPDGTFTVANVPPGSYSLVVRTGLPMRGGGADEAEMAVVSVTVSGADIAGLTVMTAKGARATGRIVLEGDPGGLSPADVRIAAVPAAEETAALAPGGPGGRVADDWTFELTGLFGTRVVAVSGLRGGWRLKAVRLAGADITDTGFEARGSQPVTGLEVILTSQSTEISGTVTGQDGRPVKDYVVLVFAQDEARWAHPTQRYTMVSRPDQEGRYAAQNLPPGDYLAVALDYLEEGTSSDPALLESLRSRATPVALADGERKVLTLRLVEP
jgi:protocatechuate 3,4-dioxygenase beta subunit